MLRLVLALLWLAGPAVAQDRIPLPRADGSRTAAMHYPVPGPAPILILSPGFGGSEDALEDLASAAQTTGYDTWVLNHPESGRAALRVVLQQPDRLPALIAAITDPAANAARRADLDALIAHIGPRFTAAPLRVYGGHSMGAQAAMIEAGATNHAGPPGPDRFDAYLALSFQGPGPVFPQNAWRGVAKPVLLATGTRDRATTGAWDTRLPAFDALPDGNAALVIIDGATHRDMSGQTSSPQSRLLREITVDFLKGLLLSPRQWPASRSGATVTAK